MTSPAKPTTAELVSEPLPAETTHERELRLKRVRRLAKFLDDGYRIPLTGVTFGWDGIIGLIPGVGDVATAACSLYIIHEARKLGLPQSKLNRMAANVGIDVLAGIVPVVGDLVDVAWKANRKNVRMIEDHFKLPPKT